jgi:aldose 1-epimerase
MERLIELQNAVLSTVVAPAEGGGLLRFDYLGRGGAEPLFRPRSGEGPFELANIVLVPWSNRISGGGFTFRGRFHALPPTRAGEIIHGNAFLAGWEVVEQSSERATLRLSSEGPGPYRYDAELLYALAGSTLEMSLRVTNRADLALPYGVGFHPWLVRTPGTRLSAAATAVWLENELHLPAGGAPVPIPPEWDFRTSTALPEGFINNGFAGWDGRAEVRWDDRGLALDVTASTELSTYIVYSPSELSPFFCFEPVSHPVDAFNLPGGAEANGLIALEPGEALAVTASYTVRQL